MNVLLEPLHIDFHRGATHAIHFDRRFLVISHWVRPRAGEEARREGADGIEGDQLWPSAGECLSQLVALPSTAGDEAGKDAYVEAMPPEAEVEGNVLARQLLPLGSAIVAAV